MGYDAAKGECNLKFWAKEISKTGCKCGQAVFIEQTSKRVSDHLILQRANNMILEDAKIKRAGNDEIPDAAGDLPSWTYTRKTAHMFYNIGDDRAEMIEYTGKKEPSPFALLTSSIRRVLKDLHGPTGIIHIWKEIKLCFGRGQGHNYVRAFHDFDSYGKFFDWVHVAVEHGMEGGGYRPAKVLLLYQTETDDNHALVWMAQEATNTELRKETNISARWKRNLIAETGLPNILSISTQDIKKSIVAFEHWKYINNNHLPSTVRIPGSDNSMFVNDESYDRYSWCLNFVDPDRW